MNRSYEMTPEEIMNCPIYKTMEIFQGKWNAWVLFELGRHLCQRGDIVVTQDYGVAALALGKGARAIHQSGRWYTDDNIDTLLMERHLAKKARRSGKHHLKGPAKRTEEDDRKFAESFERMIQEALYDSAHRP